jgi:ABC-2 type transport system ATP-binding protein
MAFDPPLLVLDEPTSGLDPLVRRAFLESMVDRAAAGQTVFLSSHQIHEVERVADYVAILHAGRLQVVSKLDDLKAAVTMISYSLRDPLLAATVEFDRSEVLHRSQSGRSFQLLVRGFKPEVQELLLRDPNLFDFKAVRPNLEELYIGFTQPLAEAGATPPHSRKPVSEVA